MTEYEKIELQILACKVRMGIIEAVHAAKSGHPGGSLSAADMFTYLYFKEMNISGWRRHYKVKGHPDFVFLDKRIAVFVDGCFWHGHDCRNTRPADNAEYWQKKRQRNMERDRSVTALFEARGWTVIRIWECELTKKNRALLDKKLQPLLLTSN